MRKLKKFWKEIFCFFSLTVLSLVIFTGNAEDNKNFKINKYLISSQKGIFEYELYEAKSEDQKRQGLQNVFSLPPRSGMLFFFNGKDKPLFWTKDTYLYLDMVYLDKKMKVLDIKHNQEPLSEERIETPHNPYYVLELLGGEAKYLNLNIGDKINLVD